jgi:hypothetical protein
LGIQEVDSLDCSGSIEDLTKTVVVDLVFLCLNGLPIDDPRLQAIANAFVSTYNRVISNYCDPYFRMLTDAEVISTGEVTEESKLTLAIKTTGTSKRLVYASNTPRTKG